MLLRTTAAALSLAALTAISTPALAGGIGLMGLGGLHTERVYYYDEELIQFKDVQYPPTVGGGLVAMLGDRDDKVLGIMKFYYAQDENPSDPESFSTEAVGAVTYNYRREDRHLGIVTAGVQWGLVGDPGAFMFNLVTGIGAGVITRDSSEFVMLDIGPGVHYTFLDAFQVFADVTFQPRYRKGQLPGAIQQSGGGSLGVRYMFD